MGKTHRYTSDRPWRGKGGYSRISSAELTRRFTSASTNATTPRESVKPLAPATSREAVR